MKKEESVQPVTRAWLARLFTFDTMLVIIVMIFSAGVIWNGVEQAIADSVEKSAKAIQYSEEAQKAVVAVTAVAESNSVKLEMIEDNQDKAMALAEKRHDQSQKDIRTIHEDIKKILIAVGER